MLNRFMWGPHIMKNNFLPPSSSLPNTPLPPSDQELISITERTPLQAPHKSIQHVTWSLLHTQHPTCRRLTVNTIIFDGNHSFAPRSQVWWYFCSLRNFSHIFAPLPKQIWQGIKERRQKSEKWREKRRQREKNHSDLFPLFKT